MDGLSYCMYEFHPDLPLIVQIMLFAGFTFFGAWFWRSGFHRTLMTARRKWP
jgi:hypothetical protein